MTPGEFRTLLASDLPSDRMAAAQWASRNQLTQAHVDILTTAASSESVSRIRATMNQALGPLSPRAIRSERVPQPIRGSTAILEDLAGIIRHELTPPIGWIRSAALREIEDFDSSRTRSRIDALARRVSGLSNLAAAYRRPRLRETALSDVVAACVDNDDYPPSLVRLSSAQMTNDVIYTDPDLLELLLANVIGNAVEACSELPKPGEVLVAMGGDGHDFWIRVSNPMSGTEFDFAAIGATGRTTKEGHRGLGTRVIELAAGALGYRFQLSASGGTATFVLEGPRGV